MSLIREINAQIAAYLGLFPEEEDRLGALNRQLADDPNGILGRKTPAGHITASTFVLNPARDAALLIHHKALDRWLQPGGHYEGDASLIEAALRETREETGIEKLRALPVRGEVNVPLDIDTHVIPARPEKGEGRHLHHDFAYLAVAASHELPALQVEEIMAARYVPLPEIALLENPRLQRLAEKAQSLFSA